MALSKPCTLCLKLKDRRIKTRSGQKLDERADEEIWSIYSKNRKHAVEIECQNIFLEGGGQVSQSGVGSSKVLLKRDYPEINDLSRKKKLGLLMIPKKIIPKHPIDLYPKKLPLAKESIEKSIASGSDIHKETVDLIDKKIKTMEIDYKGFIPEMDAGDGIKEVFLNSFA